MNLLIVLILFLEKMIVLRISLYLSRILIILCCGFILKDSLNKLRQRSGFIFVNSLKVLLINVL